ncbi:MAG: STAS domain-containing protein [Bacteroidota bacterium]
MAQLSIDTDMRRAVGLMRVSGRVDSETAPQLDRALSQLLADRSNVVLNLQGVDYLSSAGLRAMVKAYQEARRAGGDVRLSAVSEPIEVILRTVGMMQMLKMFPSDQEALESF